MISLLKKAYRILKTPLFSPAGFFVSAGIIVFIFVIAHISGLREYTCILSGTAPSGDMTDLETMILGAIYVISYFAFVMVAPVFILGAGIFAGIQRLITLKN